jgi:hypothetical protein
MGYVSLAICTIHESIELVSLVSPYYAFINQNIFYMLYVSPFFEILGLFE